MFPTIGTNALTESGLSIALGGATYKEFELEVQPGVTEIDPTVYTKEFPLCKLEKTVISFPPGPNREVYVQVWHECKAMYPEDPNEWITGEDTDVEISGPWEDWDGLYELKLRMCAPQARLSHKIIFRFDLGPATKSTLSTVVADSMLTKALPIPEEWGG